MYTRVDSCFTVHKLAWFSSNPGKLNFGGMENCWYILETTGTWDKKYYDKIKDTPLSELLRQARIKT